MNSSRVAWHTKTHRKSTHVTCFVALVVLGALSIGAGFALRISPAVSAGLSYGGVLSFVIASIRYWGEAGDIIRLIIVGIALAALIAIGIQKFKGIEGRSANTLLNTTPGRLPKS